MFAQLMAAGPAMPSSCLFSRMELTCCGISHLRIRICQASGLVPSASLRMGTRPGDESVVVWLFSITRIKAFLCGKNALDLIRTVTFSIVAVTPCSYQSFMYEAGRQKFPPLTVRSPACSRRGMRSKGRILLSPNFVRSNPTSMCTIYGSDLARYRFI